MADRPAFPAAGPAAAPSAHDAIWRLYLRGAQTHARVLMDVDGTVRAWAGAAAKVFGYSEAEMLGRPIDDLFTPEDIALGLPQHERQVALSGARAGDDRWYLRRDGSRIWVTGSMEAVRDEAGQVVALAKVMRDRSDLRAQLDALSRRGDVLAAAASHQAAFNASLVHELRNVLAPLANANSLLARATGLDDHVTFASGLLGRQLALLQRLVDDLVDAGTQAQGGLQLTYGNFELVELVQEVGVRFAGLADAGKLEVLVPAQGVHIEADRRRIEQCLSNLLDNAIKYTPGQGRVWLKLTVEGDQAVLRVEDQGVGIDATFLPQAFDMAARERIVRTKGLGVGLGLVRQIAAAHGGMVDLRSEGRGRGCEVALRLPLKPPTG